MNPVERLFALKVSLIMSVRMLGLFMLFPVMSVYAGDYESPILEVINGPIINESINATPI